jgi:hypothetical protein
MTKSTIQLTAEYDSAASDAVIKAWYAEFRAAEKREHADMVFAEFPWQVKDAQVLAIIAASMIYEVA